MALFTFHSKNYALNGEHELTCDHLPRVGELIYADSGLGLVAQTPRHYFVYKVIHEADKKGVVAHVYGREWFNGLRHEELMRRGWLIPDVDSWVEHDED
jgi:hypothetical protein